MRKSFNLVHPTPISHATGFNTFERWLCWEVHIEVNTLGQAGCSDAHKLPIEIVDAGVGRCRRVVGSHIVYGCSLTNDRDLGLRHRFRHHEVGSQTFHLVSVR